ncbi:lipid-A-disaccharide synthase [Negadavirga shengliensis]|uniref:Lipid-A-disaccharide synthase n=1 Tax=Negadavirga shengliensis TaxID=1389218 RepID=A0ABV9T7U9_9BACT
MKIYIIAGERSGDLHASNLISALSRLDPSLEFRGMGGEYMEQSGCVLAAHYKEIALMGFVEVLLHFRRVLKYLNLIKKDITAFRPDAIVLVDFAGFNMKIARFAHDQHIPVHYYISPKVWAWNQKRAFKLKRYIDRLYAILPFEPDFFRKFDWEVDYVGNPLKDEIAKFKPNPDFLNRHQLGSKPIVALLPGSRKQEVEMMLKTMVALKERMDDVAFVVAAVSNLPDEVYLLARKASIPLVYNQTYDLLAYAKAAVVTSGTATLETALFGVPQLVVYRTSALSFYIARQLIKVPYISLVNLIAGREVVKELIQEDYRNEEVERELSLLINHEGRIQDVRAGYNEVEERIGHKKASQETARLIYTSLEKA